MAVNTHNGLKPREGPSKVFFRERERGKERQRKKLIENFYACTWVAALRNARPTPTERVRKLARRAREKPKKPGAGTCLGHFQRRFAEDLDKRGESPAAGMPQGIRLRGSSRHLGRRERHAHTSSNHEEILTSGALSARQLSRRHVGRTHLSAEELL